MTENQKFIAGALLGAAAGAAVVFFLSSDKGKDLVSHLKDLSGDSYDKVKSKATDLVNHLKKDAKEKVGEMKDRVGEMA